MSNFEQFIYFNDLSTTSKVRVSAGPSGSYIQHGNGLYLDDDSADPTSSTLLPSGSIISGSITEGVIYNGTTNWSIGIDQGRAYNTSMVILIDDGSAGYGITFSGSGDSLTSYQSTDNSTWSLVQNYQPLTRVVASGSSVDNPNAPMMILILGDFTQRYIKLHADNGPLKSVVGNTLWFSGIQTYQENPLTWSSGSYSDKIHIIVTSDQVANPEKKEIPITYNRPFRRGNTFGA